MIQMRTHDVQVHTLGRCGNGLIEGPSVRDAIGELLGDCCFSLIGNDGADEGN